MGKIVTPMDVALAGLKVWRVQAQSAALATMDMTELAHEMMTPARGTSPRGRSREASGRDRG